MSRLGRHLSPLGGAAFAVAGLLLGLPAWRGDWSQVLTLGLALAAGLAAAFAARWADDPAQRRLLLALSALSPVALIAPPFQPVAELASLRLFEAALVLDALWTLSWRRPVKGEQRGRGRLPWLVFLYGGALALAGTQPRLAQVPLGWALPPAWVGLGLLLAGLAAIRRLLRPDDLNQEVAALHSLWAIVAAGAAIALAAWLSAGRAELLWAAAAAAIIAEVGLAARDLHLDRLSFSMHDALAPALVAALFGLGAYFGLAASPGPGRATVAGAVLVAALVAWPLSLGLRAALRRVPPRSRSALERAAREVEELADEAQDLDALVRAFTPLGKALPRGRIALVTFDPDWTLILGDDEVESRTGGPGAVLRDLLATPFHVRPLLARRVIDRSVRDVSLRPTAELAEELETELIVPVPGGAATPLVGALLVGGPQRGWLRGWRGGRLLEMARPMGTRIRAAVEAEAASRQIRELEGAQAAAEDQVERLEYRLERLGEENRLLRADRAGTRPTEVVGRSEAMEALLADIAHAARVPASLLIRGEAGTGRTLVARSIHEASDRREGPMVRLDCTGTAPALHCEALVGRADGAGARPGLFELADQGTLVLEEVGALSLDAQAELIRLLASGEVARITSGEGRPSLRHVDVRVMATTGRTSEGAVARDTLLPELHDRLKALQVDVPPLRARTGDIPQLAQFFLEKAVQRHGLAIDGFSPEALDALEGYRWPGNVRQLRAVIEHAALAARGTKVSSADLPPLENASLTATPSLDEFLSGTYDEIERAILLYALERARGNKTEAARLLGLKRTTFVSRLQKHQLDTE